MGFDRFGSFESSRSSSGSFFTNEAIRAGYITSGLAGSHLIGRRLSSRDALRWEIEKDRIRAEMVADIIRRRQLEEEVRRELALEREMVLRRELQLLDSLAPVSSDVEADNRFSVGGKPLPKSGFLIDRLRPEVGSSSEPALAEPRAAVEKQVVLPVKTSNEIFRGAKRKVPAPPGAANAQEKELPWLAIPRKKTKLSQCVWTCELCNISCTSRDSLADHQLGKKHKAKLDELRPKKEEGPPDKMDRTKPQPTATKAAGVANGGPVAGAAEKKLKKEPGSKKQLKGKTVEPRPKKQNVKKKSGGFMFWCGYCGVECNSEVVRDSHLKGKKHAAKLEELKTSGDAGDRDMPVDKSLAKVTDGSEAATCTQQEDASANEGEDVLEHKENEGVELVVDELVVQKEHQRIEAVPNKVREQKEDGEMEDACDDTEEQGDDNNQGRM
ncbi:unnamed protein product [Victoria cruziana]